MLPAIFVSEQEKNVTSFPLVIKTFGLFLRNRSRDINFQSFWDTGVPIVYKRYCSTKK